MVCKGGSDPVLKIAVIGLHIYSILRGRVMRKTIVMQSELHRSVCPQLEKTKLQFLLTPIHLFH